MKKTYAALMIMSLCFWSINTVKSAPTDILLKWTNLSTFMQKDIAYTLYFSLENVGKNGSYSPKIYFKVDNGVGVEFYVNGSIAGGVLTTSQHLYSLSISTEGMHNVKCWVYDANDTNRLNDTISYNVMVGSNYFKKVSLFENLTGTWCQYCPPAIEKCELMDENDNIAVAVFHLSDQLSFKSGSDYFVKYFNGSTTKTPSGMINKGQYNTYPVNSYTTVWQNLLGDKFNENTYASLTTNKTLNKATRELKVDMSAQFKYAISGDYAFNVYLLEDSLYAVQTNSSIRLHDNIVRAMLGGEDGISGKIPATPVVGTDYTHSFTYTIPAGINLNNVRVLGLLISTTNGKKAVLNATREKKSYTSIIPSKITSDSEQPIALFKDNTTNRLNIQTKSLDAFTLEIYSIAGAKIYSEKISNRASDNMEFDLNNLNLSSGSYIAKVSNNQLSVSKHFVY